MVEKTSIHQKTYDEHIDKAISSLQEIKNNQNLQKMYEEEGNKELSDRHSRISLIYEEKYRIHIKICLIAMNNLAGTMY